jgi:DNA-binding transcriptional LysR family regulator
METDSVEAIKSFVAVGLGVSFLPEAAVEVEVASGTLARVEVTSLQPLKRGTSVVYRPDRYLSTAARAFMSVLCGRYRSRSGEASRQ